MPRSRAGTCPFDEEIKLIENLHTGGDSVVDVLSMAGIDVVFGIPSIHNLPIYDALRRRGLRTVTVRHEQTAAGAADGFSRISGNLGVFLTSTGPGAANAMGGLLEAFLSGSPVLHITGQIETEFIDQGKGFIHEVPNQPEMLESLSKAVLRVRKPEEIASVVADAVAAALTTPTGPVSVEIPIDLQYVATPVPPPDLLERRAPSSPPSPRPDLLRQAIKLIEMSRCPIVWAGGGSIAAGAQAEVAELCHLRGAALITSANGRGIMDERDPLCIGNFPVDPDVRSLFGDADLLIAIGTRYQGPNTDNWKLRLPDTILQIDVDPDRPARNYKATLALQGDARAVLQSLIGDGEGLGTTHNTEWRERIASVKMATRNRLREFIGAQEELLDVLSTLLEPDTPVVKDATIPAYTWGNRLLPVSRPRTSIVPNGFAIGLGLPHAIGASLASQCGGHESSDLQSAVLIVGDGGFMLAATDLATLASESLPLLVIVFVDGGYGILRNIQDSQYGGVSGRIGVDLNEPDFVRLSTALGVQAEKVSTAAAFRDAVQVALQSRLPHLIAVQCEEIGPMADSFIGSSRPPLNARLRP